MIGAVIVSHSSHDDNGAGALLARRLREEHGVPATVLKEESTESLERAIRGLADEGADEVVVIPLFIASNMLQSKPFDPSMLPQEVRDKIPKDFKFPEPMVIPESLDAGGRQIGVRIGRLFAFEPGMDEVMGDILERHGAQPGRTAVVVVGHGSMDDSSPRAVRNSVDLIRARGFDAFDSYNEMNEPSVGDAVDAAVAQGFEDVLVIPLFVSPGVHSSDEVPEKIGVPKDTREAERDVDGRRVRVRYAHEVGMEPGVARIVAAMLKD